MDPSIQNILLQVLAQGRGAPQQPPSNLGLPGGFGNPALDYGMSDPSVSTPAEDFIVSPQPSKPHSADTRMEGYRRLLTDFTYSLGAGLEAANASPSGRAQRTQAGMGAILQVPHKLEAARQEYQFKLAQEKQRLAEARAAEARANSSDLNNLLLPEKLRALTAGTSLTTAKADVLPQQVANQTTAANTAANRAKYISSPKGLMDISSGTPVLVPDSGPMEMTVTKEIAEKFGHPELVGAKVPTSTFNEIIKPDNPHVQIHPMQDPDGKTTGLYAVDLDTNATTRLGNAKSDVLSEAAEKQKIRIAAAAASNKETPLSPEDVEYIADQADADPTGTIMPKLVGRNQKGREQVVSELRSRDADLRVLTSSTRQLGETAHELMPNFEHALTLLDDKGVQGAMGPLGSRWQEFLAGRIGTSDPAFRGISTETIGKMNDLRAFTSLLQTGTARAHVGARGSSQLIEKFEKIFNSDKMDATTLKDSLSSTKSFLKTYENAVYGSGASSSRPAAGMVRIQTSDGKVGSVPVDKVDAFMAAHPGSVKQ